MKKQTFRKLLVMLISGLLVVSMLLTSCQKPATPPTDNPGEQPGTDEPGTEEPGTDTPGTEEPGTDEPGGDEPVDDTYVILSDKGHSLYNATYQTMLDRLMQDGYAQTSLTGTYQGMFVRDASIQVMAHIAEGDMDAAMRILKYMAAYHKAIGSNHAIHIMDALPDDVIYDYVVGEKQPIKQASGSNSQNVSQMGYETALYLIQMPEHKAAQTFSVPFNNIAEIAVALDIGSTSGTICLSIGYEPDDSSVAYFEFDIAEVVRDGKWARFIFDEPVSIVPNETYIFTIGAKVPSGSVVAFGKLSAGGAYNYDPAAYGGWIKESHAIGHQIRTDASITGEENAASHTFVAGGDRIDTIDILFTGNEPSAIHATLTDASGNVIKQVAVDTEIGTAQVKLNMGVTVTEGAEYTLSIWAENGRTTWELTNDETPFMIITPEYSGSKLSASVTLGGSVIASQILNAETCGKYVTTAKLYLSSVGTVGADDTFTVSLYCGKVLVDQLTLPLSTLTETASAHTFDFCLPLEDLNAEADYSIQVSASREGSLKWYGLAGADSDRPAKLGNATQDLVLSYDVGCSLNIAPLSKTVQVDGHYMWMNAFAMFVLEAETNYKGQYDAFITAAYPFMESYAKYFFETTGAVGGNVGFIDETYGLMYTPSYEHSRDGRYWKAFDLITNVFCSEAAHKMSAVAKVYGTSDMAAQFKTWADDLATAIHKELVRDFNGKSIYIDLIDVENGKVFDGYAYKTEENYRVYLGFSFVNLAPLAAEWYAMDDEIMKNTYEAYFNSGSEKYGKYDVLGVVVNLDKENNTVKIGNHVIGKGFAWELHYAWATGNTERVNELIDFMETRSTDVYPEVWRKDGSVSDSANQEHANWILYTMARITGKYTAPVVE